MHIAREILGTQKRLVLLFLVMLLCAPPSLARSTSNTALYLGTPGFSSANQADELQNRWPNYQSQRQRDYLGDVQSDGLYCWPQAHLPIKVFFAESADIPGYKDSFRRILSECFNEWVEASQGKLGWREVSTPEESDVVCRWTDQVREGAAGAEAGRTRTYASLNTLTNRGIIHRGEMTLLTRLPERLFTDEEIRKSYLHEVGHVFGIAGHSTHRQDIMYYSISGMRFSHLSDQDKTTINRLYSNYSASNSQGREINALN